jgi:hypothetical protein
VKLKATGAAPDLRSDTIAILLAGWSAQEPNPTQHDGFGGGFFELAEADGAATLWRQHERYLRRVAAAWGWEPAVVCSDGVRRFYGEARAAGFHDHELETVEPDSRTR